MQKLIVLEEAYVQTDMKYLQEHSTTNDDGYSFSFKLNLK